ncbi:MAG: hypothetical protein ACKVOX_18775 [Rhizobacter sp.]
MNSAAPGKPKTIRTVSTGGPHKPANLVDIGFASFSGFYGLPDLLVLGFPEGASYLTCTARGEPRLGLAVLPPTRPLPAGVLSLNTKANGRLGESTCSGTRKPEQTLTNFNRQAARLAMAAPAETHQQTSKPTEDKQHAERGNSNDNMCQQFIAAQRD